MRKRARCSQWGIIVISIITCMVMLYIELALEPVYLIKSILKIGLFLGAIILSAMLFKTRLFLSEVNKGKLKTCACIALIAYLILVVLYFLFNSYIDMEQIKYSLMTKEQVDSNNFIYVAIYITIANSFIEEVFFRGFVFLNLEDLGYRKLGCIYSAALFAVYHIGIVASWFNIYIFILSLLGLFGAGLLLNYFAYSGKTFLCSWPLHVAANLGINTIGFIILQI